MNFHPELSKISQVTNNIFLSGVFPMEQDPTVIKKLNIKYILACLDRQYVSDAHNAVLIDNPECTILYLPYDDDVSQNLWCKNKNTINLVKYTRTMEEYNGLYKQFQMYQNKPMIEIGYNFINNAVESGNNILIHCMAGISRSVSTLTYYLMKKYNIPYSQAIKYVKDRRSIVNPNDSFKLQLQGYQSKKENFVESDGKKVTDFFKYGQSRFK